MDNNQFSNQPKQQRLNNTSSQYNQYNQNNQYYQDSHYNQDNQQHQNNQYYQNNPNTYNPNGYGTQTPPYYNPAPRRPYDPNSEPMTLKDWVITFLLLMIPIANIILPFVWAFGSDVNKSKKTFFQAYLLYLLVGFIFSIGFLILGISLFASILDNLPDYSSLALTYTSILQYIL